MCRCLPPTGWRVKIPKVERYTGCRYAKFNLVV
jgi:hypothetical protein